MPTNVNHAKCHNEKNDVITLSDDEECSNASKQVGHLIYQFFSVFFLILKFLPV